MRKGRFVIALLAAGLFCLVPYTLADWSPAKRLTWTSGDSTMPALVVDPSNNVHVFWSDNTPGKQEIYYKRSEDGGATWDTVRRLTWNAGDSVFPSAAVDSTGTLHIVWCDDTPGNYEVFYRGSTDGGTTWSANKRLTWNPGNSSRPALIVDASDIIHLVWDDYTSGQTEIYYKRSTDGGATWSANKRLTWNSGNSAYPALAHDSSNALHVVWHDYTPGNAEIYYKNSPDGGTTWSAVQKLTITSDESLHSAIAVDSSDTIQIVWQDFVSNDVEIFYRKSEDGGVTWSLAQRLSWTSWASYNPSIAIDSTQTIYVVWDDYTPGNYEILLTKSTDGGISWSTPQRLTWTSGSSRFPAAAMDSENAIHIVWDDATPGNREIYYKKGS